MMARLCVAIAAALLVAGGTAASGQDTIPLPTDAYQDEAAREMVRLARERRAMFDSRIQAYSTTAVERISAGLRAGPAERLLYRRESAARIDWTLDTVRIEVLGARNVVPPFSGMPQVPSDLDSYMPSLAFDPVDSEMMLRLDSTDLRHPLAIGSEAHYRFASGDSTVISLPDGRTVRLRELRILPRRRDPQLIAGSFWVDAASHAVVQAYFRQSRPFDADIDDDDCDLTCRLAMAVIRPVRMELEYIAIDYALWDLHWWLPRTIAARGILQAGRFKVPIEFERRYDDYSVTGDTVASAAAADSMRTRPCRPRVAFTISVGSSEPDSAQIARRDSVRAAERASTPADTTAGCDRRFIVTTADRAELLTSDLLPSSIYDGVSGVIRESDLEAIREGLRRIPEPQWQIPQPAVLLPADIRYNRVEGLSASAGLRVDLGRLSVDALAGLGTGDWRPRAELGITRVRRTISARLGGYARLETLDPTAHPFSLGSSLAAVLLGHDDHEYFRTTGGELTVRPPDARPQWYTLRLYAERQRSARQTTDFSLAHSIDADNGFRSNSPADPATQAGAALTLRTSGGLDPAAFRWAAELELLGEAGDYEFIRPSARLQASVPAGRFEIAAELAGGATAGGAPRQREWLVGGTSSLRGYPAAALRGDAFWRARAELGYGMPFARLSLFSDLGFAGPRHALRDARPLSSAGIGITFLDGLVRIDLARPLDGGSWRLHSRIR